MSRGVSGEQLEVTTLAMLVLCALIVLAVMWWQLGHYIVNAAIVFATALIRTTNWLYHLLPSSGTVDAVFFLFVDEAFVRDQDAVISRVRSYHGFHPTLEQARDVFYVIGYFLRYPILLLAVWGSYLAYRYSRPSQLKRIFDIYTLAEYSKQYFPQIKPAIDGKLLNYKDKEGPHRQEESPFRFAILNNAIKYINEDGEVMKVSFGKGYKENPKKGIATIIDSYDEDEGMPVIHGRCVIDIPTIRKAFVNQIIAHGRWESSSQLPPQLKALYAVFLLFIKGGEANKEKGLAMLDRFSATYRSTKKLNKALMFDDKGVEEVIAELEDRIAVKNVIKRHTYTINVLIALYHRSTYRKSKLPPSRFLWLKEVDRNVWYALNQNLSPAAWTEAAGPRGLELTERKLKKKANYPFTDNAIAGYLKYINNEGWLLEQPENTVELAN